MRSCGRKEEDPCPLRMPVETVWEPQRKNDDPCDQVLEVVLRFPCVSGLQKRQEGKAWEVSPSEATSELCKRPRLKEAGSLPSS